MIDSLAKLESKRLSDLAAAIRSGRLQPPYTALAIQRLVDAESAHDAAAGLNSLNAMCVSVDATAVILGAMIAARGSRVAADDVIDLVTSGPDVAGSANRDTAVVVRDLFAYAERSVWIAGYAVQNGRRIFRALADRMLANPDLKVSLIVDVRRGPGDTTLCNDLLRRFTRQFQERDWPADRPLPRMFYFPRAMDADPRGRGSLHAKCVVVDGETCFVSSANFTAAAHNKNLEIGLLVRSAIVAGRLQRFLEGLVDGEIVCPLT